MDIADIHWHDSVVRKIVELPDPDRGEHRLLIEVDYPIDWENNVIQTYTIQFVDVFSYEIHEGPCVNVPTLLDANEIAEDDDSDVRTIRIETTGGYRIVQCVSLSLAKGEAIP